MVSECEETGITPAARVPSPMDVQPRSPTTLPSARWLRPCAMPWFPYQQVEGEEEGERKPPGRETNQSIGDARSEENSYHSLRRVIASVLLSPRQEGQSPTGAPSRQQTVVVVPWDDSLRPPDVLRRQRFVRVWTNPPGNRANAED